jgi:glycosyltransferase involved in cell wall biosynthesis
VEPDVHHPRSAAELISLIRRIDHDVLHLHVGGDINRRVLSLAVAAATLGNRPILTMHSGGYADTDAAQKARPSSARGRIFRQFAHVVAVNDALADVFRRYGVRDEKLTTILPFFLTPPGASVELRPDIEDFCKQHSPLLVSVGGLEPDYEPLFLVEAMNDVRRAFPNAGLVIVGGGSLKDKVQDAVGEHDHILLAGNVPHAETLQLIARADAMLRITLFDGDAISVRESLFVGTPVVATDNGMRPAGVRVMGRGDKNALLGHIKQIADEPQPRPKGLAADYSNIDEVLDLYDRLIWNL